MPSPRRPSPGTPRPDAIFAPAATPCPRPSPSSASCRTLSTWTVAARQHAVSTSGDLSHFGPASDERDRVMAGLVTIEDQLKQIRHALSDGKDETKRLPGYAEVIELRRACVALVTRILDTDKDS